MQLVADEGTHDREAGPGERVARALALVGDREDGVAAAGSELDAHGARPVLERVLEQLGEDERQRGRATAGERDRLEPRLDLAPRADPLHEHRAQPVDQLRQLDVLLALLGERLVDGRDREDPVDRVLERLARIDALGAHLQTVASLLRLQARAEGLDPREALEHSVNRILAIAAVHEALTEQREEDVELAELIDRLRAMLVQGLGGGREVEARLEHVSLAGSRATALALVFSELLQNALEHGAGAVRIELVRHGDEVVLAIADEGPGADGVAAGTGLSIVRALVSDELQGSFELRGPRAEVVFPA